jgi:hypothetical protein
VNEVVLIVSEDELQIAVHQLHKIIHKYGMKISTQKTKIFNGIIGRNIKE